MTAVAVRRKTHAVTAVAVRRKTHTVTADAVRMKRERRGDYCCRKEKDAVTVSRTLTSVAGVVCGLCLS